MRGRSRSVGVVMCYLIYSLKMSSIPALLHVKKMRPIANPIQEILVQVSDFERRLPLAFPENDQNTQLQSEVREALSSIV